MMTMKERALAVGGTFRVKSSPEIGTQVVVRCRCKSFIELFPKKSKGSDGQPMV